MIPRAHITVWRASAPWPQDEQVEQDLVLSRALTAIFGRPSLRQMLAFRGGTALARTETAISRAEFEANMAGKLTSPDFRADVVPLLRDLEGYDVDVAALLVHDRLIARLPGEQWKALGRER